MAAKKAHRRVRVTADLVIDLFSSLWPSVQEKCRLKIILGVLMMLGAYSAGCGRIDLWPGWCYAAFFLSCVQYIVFDRCKSGSRSHRGACVLGCGCEAMG